MTTESISLCINLFQETPPNPAEVSKSIKGKKGKLTFDDDHLNPQDNGGYKSDTNAQGVRLTSTLTDYDHQNHHITVSSSICVIILASVIVDCFTWRNTRTEEMILS